MATQLTNQDYIYASEIAYKDAKENPADLVAKYLSQYGVSDFVNLGNGFQVLALKSKSDGHYLIGFRGTLPNYQGTIDHFMNVEVDQQMIAEAGIGVSSQEIEKYNNDQTALQNDTFLQDLRADSEIFKGQDVEQFSSALSYVMQTVQKSAGKPVYVTGHSLGGGIANHVAGLIPNITGTTFAAPGYKGYGKASAGSMINYYNVNDTIPTVNLPYHCGACVALDILHSSYAVENQLGIGRQNLYGFNGEPNPTAALTAHGDKVGSIALASIGFLAARLIYHQLPNYAGWVNCQSITGQATKYTLRDFANAAQKAITASMWLKRQSQNPVTRIVHYEIRLIRQDEKTFIRIMSAYGQAMIDMGQYGYGFPP